MDNGRVNIVIIAVNTEIKYSCNHMQVFCMYNVSTMYRHVCTQ